MDITKVNVEELTKLANRLEFNAKDIALNFQEYRKCLKMITDAGYLKGKGVTAINIAHDTINKRCEKLEAKALELAKIIRDVVTETQNTDNAQSNAMEEILISDPIEFVTTVAGTTLSFFNNMFKNDDTNSNASSGSQSSTSTTPSQNQSNASTTTPPAGSTPTETIPETKPAEIRPNTNTSTTTKMDVPPGKTSFKSYTKVSALAHNTPQSAVARGETMPSGKYKGTTYNTQTDPDTMTRYVTFDGSDEKYYCVAMGTHYGQVGDTFKITTDKGNEFNVIMTDVKGRDAVGYGDGTSYYHDKGNNKCVVEFYIEDIPDAIRVPGGTTGTFDTIDKFSGNISSIEKYN